MEQRQWQEVFSIVRKHQRNLSNTQHTSEYYIELRKILDELYPLAYGVKV